jgi:hypothetical protein
MSDEIRDVDQLERRPAEGEDEYDDSVPPIWQSVVELGASLPAEEWDRLPTDFAANLERYLYGNDGTKALPATGVISTEDGG